MAKSQRIALLIVAPLMSAIWLAGNTEVLSKSEETEKRTIINEQASASPQQVAESIVTIAKERVQTAKTEAEAIRRIQLSSQALQAFGSLGGFDTSGQVNELFDALQDDTRPAIVDMVMQHRMSNTIRKWPTMNKAARAAALDDFVSATKKTGLSPTTVQLITRATFMVREGDDNEELIKALRELAPVARNSEDAKVKHMADIYEGIARRLELPGNPLEMEGTLLNGTKLDWDSYHGKVVLVDFHASWCGPCRAEVPNILTNYDAYHEKGFEVIGVNMDTDRKGAQKYIDETGFKFPIIFSDDPKAKAWDNPLARKYGVIGIPQVILVDRNGKVVSTNARGDQLKKLLTKLLGEPAQKEASEKDSKNDASETPAPPDPDSSK